MTETTDGNSAARFAKRRAASDYGVRQYFRELASERRLDAAFAEMDRELYGREAEVDMDSATKVYQCKQCEESFGTSQALAGHVHRSHPKPKSPVGPPSRRKPRPGPRSFLCRKCGETFGDMRELAAHKKSAHASPIPPAEEASQAEEIRCPLCVRPLPPAAAWLAKEFTKEGLEEEKAARLAAIAFGQLSVPE